jgi:hypothetical protein
MDQRPHQIAGHQVELRSVHRLDGSQRDPDVGNHHVAGDVFRRRQDQGHLGRRQGDGEVGLQHRPDEFTGVGRQTRRQVDGDHRRAGGVDVGDHRFVQPAERPAEPGPDDGVDDHVGRRHLRTVQFPRLRVGQFDNRNAEPADDVEVDSGVAADVGQSADHVDGGVDAALLEGARDDEAVAAVVAGAAQNRHLA